MEPVAMHHVVVAVAGQSTVREVGGSAVDPVTDAVGRRGGGGSQSPGRTMTFMLVGSLFAAVSAVSTSPRP